MILRTLHYDARTDTRTRTRGNRQIATSLHFPRRPTPPTSGRLASFIISLIVVTGSRQRESRVSILTFNGRVPNTGRRATRGAARGTTLPAPRIIYPGAHGVFRDEGDTVSFLLGRQVRRDTLLLCLLWIVFPGAGSS